MGAALSRAICAGMGNVQDFPENASAGDWQAFLISEVDAIVRAEGLHIPQPQIVSKVNGVFTYFDLTQVSPQLAARYYQACL